MLNDSHNVRSTVRRLEVQELCCLAIEDQQIPVPGKPLLACTLTHSKLPLTSALRASPFNAKLCGDSSVAWGL